MNRKKFFSVLVLLLGAAGIAFSGGRSEETTPERSYPITVVATTGMIGNIVEEVGGDFVSVTTLMREEVDPHLFRPTRADVERLQRADIVFYNGLMLEGRMGDTLVQVARSRPVYAVTELIEEDVLLEDDEYEEAWDPHLWMDVRLWMKAVDVVVEALSGYDPDNARSYRENADRYLEELDELDQYVRRIVVTIPESRRVLVTAHDAFGYFGEAYGLTELGVQGISTESEAGLEDINSLVRFVVDNGVSAVFAETTVPDRALQAVIEGAAARGHTVSIGGELFSDAMGPAGTYEGTYIGMIDHNATTIVRALGGDAPERGFRGRLGR